MVGHFDSHMRQSDAFSWYMERDPLLRSTVVAVLVFDREPDETRLLNRLERASRIVPGLRHHLVEPPMRLAPPRWVADPNFDLSWHARRVDAPAPRDLASVFELARKEGMSGGPRMAPSTTRFWPESPAGWRAITSCMTPAWKSCASRCRSVFVRRVTRPVETASP